MTDCFSLQGDIADMIGRRPTIIMGCGIFAIGCTLEIAPQDVLALFVIGRLVAGLGVGFISAILILYMVWVHLSDPVWPL